MRDDYSQFKARHLNVAAVAQGTPEQTAGLCRRHQVEFTCLADPERKAYRAYGLERGNMMQVMGPQTWLRGMRAMMKGNFVGAPIGDVMQMPGTFIIGADGALRFCHYGKDAADHPENAALLAAV